jgi:hypothetical protein
MSTARDARAVRPPRTAALNGNVFKFDVRQISCAATKLLLETAG